MKVQMENHLLMAVTMGFFFTPPIVEIWAPYDYGDSQKSLDVHSRDRMGFPVDLPIPQCEAPG